MQPLNPPPSNQQSSNRFFVRSGQRRPRGRWLWALAALATWGCAAPPEVRPGSGPIEPLQLASFSSGWATDLDLQNDSVTSLHVRDDGLYVYTDGGVVRVLGDQGRQLWGATIASGAGGQLLPPVLLKDRVAIPTRSTFELFDRYGTPLKSLDARFFISTKAVGDGLNNIYVGGNFGGSSRAVAVQIPADVSKFFYPTRWELLLPRGGIIAAPALMGDAVYVASGDGEVHAIATRDREPLWAITENTFKTGGPVRGDLAVDATTLYVASGDSKLYALNRNTGRIQWQFFSGVALEEGPTLTKDMVFQFVPGAGIAAFSKTEGPFNRRPVWLLAGAKQFLSSDDSNVYVLTDDNYILAVDKASGEFKFKSRRNDFSVYAVNTRGDGTVYASTKRGRVVAVKPVLRPGGTGEVVWLDEGPTDAMASAR